MNQLEGSDEQKRSSGDENSGTETQRGKGVPRTGPPYATNSNAHSDSITTWFAASHSVSTWMDTAIVDLPPDSRSQNL